jgi:hypothetical protein
MSTLDNFGAYAAAFELTFVDDDWSRLKQYFIDDAVYEVKGAGFDCRIKGPDAIFKGMKKSINGFDRQLDSRTIEVTSEPEVTDDSVSLDWTVTYTKEGAPNLLLRGHSEARFDGDRIAWMQDSYTDEMTAEAAEWLMKNAPGLSGSYT